MILFQNEFELLSDSGKVEFGTPILPEYVYDALREVRKVDTEKGLQEDAAEFLALLLDSLHEELLSLAGANPKDIEDWTQIGKNNKVLKTRSTSIRDTLISKLFFGKFKTTLSSAQTHKNILVTIEPFQMLQLDVQRHLSIEESLTTFTSEEIVQNKNGPMIRQTFLEELPFVLIIQLKRFVYDSNLGVQKLGRFVTYPQFLEIGLGNN
jgi:ubiquitin carboxyl-terminal hydrolase 10